MLTIATLTEATQAIANETCLEAVLVRLLRLVLDYTNIERGLVLLKQNCDWQIAATAQRSPCSVTGWAAAAGVSSRTVPLSVLQHVDCTQTELILSEPIPSPFADDPYLTQLTQQFEPSSAEQSIVLIGLPLVVQGTLLGIFYLEYQKYHLGNCLENYSIADGVNSHPIDAPSLVQRVDAVDADEIQLIRFLCSQAVIALERLDQQRWQFAIEAINAAVWDWDLSTGKSYRSAHWYELLGYTPGEVPPFHTAWIELIHPDDRERVVALIDVCLTGAAPRYSAEYRIRCRNGRYKWFRSQGVVKRNTEGKPVRLVGCNTDLTALRTTEMALKQSQTRFREVFDSTVQFMGVFTPEGRFLDANCTALDFAGLNREQIIDRYVWDTPWFDQLPASQSQLRQAFQQAAQGEICRFELALRGKTGEVRITDASCKPLYDRTGRVYQILGEARDITDRKQVELALQASEVRYWQIVEQQTDLICRFLPDGTLIFVNEAYCRYFGRSRQELIGQSFFNLIPEMDWQAVRTSLARLTPDHRVITCEHQVVLPNGRICWQQWTDQAFYDADGNLLELQSVGRDITERKLAEIELQTSEAHNRAIINAIPDLMLRVRHDGTCLDLIPPKHGTQKFVPIQSHLAEVLPPDLLEQQLFYIRQALTIGQIQVYEHQFPTSRDECHDESDDEYRDEEVRISPLSADEVLIFIRDISQRKRTEAERQQAEVALQRSEERFRNLVETSTDWVWEVDQQFVFTYASPRCWEMLGYKPEEILGRSALDLMPSEDAKRVAEIWNAIAARYQPFHCLEKVHYHKDGHLVFLETSGVPVFNAVGQFCGYRGIARDITDRKQTEASLQSLVAGTASVTGEDFFPALVSQLAAALNVEHATVSRYQNDCFHTLAFWSKGQLQPHRIYRADSVQACRLTLEQGVFCCERNAQDLFHGRCQAIQMLQAESYLGVALVNSQGQAIGTVCILDSKPLLNPSRYLTLLQLFAVRAAAELERQQAELALHQLNQELEQRVVQRTQELLQIQTALQQSEQFLRSIYEGVDYPIFVLDVLADGSFRQTGWNPACEREIGQTNAEINGKKLEEIISDPARLQEMQAFFTRCLQAGTSISQEEYQNFQGQSSWYLTTLNPLRDQTGRIYRIVGTAFDITDRKRAEAALQESQQFAQRIADNIPNVLYIYDLTQDRHMYINQELVNCLGYTIAEVKAMHLDQLMNLLHPDDLEAHRIHGRRLAAATDGEVLEIEYRIRHANGDWRWFYSRDAVFRRSATGKVTQIIGTAQDITVRKQLEQEQARLLAILEASPDYVGIASPTGDVLWLNSQFKQLVGLPADASAAQFAQYKIVDFHPGWATEIICNQGIPYAAQHGIWLGETCLHNPNGEDIPVSQLILRHTSGNGEIQYLSTIMRDIGDRKRAELAIRQSEERLQLALEGSGDGLWDWNVLTGESYFSPLWFEMLGYEANEWPAHVETWKMLMHPDDRVAVMPQLHRHLSGHTSSYSAEFRLRTKSGEWKWISAHGKVVARNPAGEPLRMLGTHRDISDRKRAEAALQQANLELESRVEARTAELRQAKEAAEAASLAKSTFLANMSHELRTPLNAILGFSQLMTRDPSLTLEQQQQLGIINRNGEHLLTLINDILEMSKIEAGRTVLNPNNFDLYRLLHSVEEMFRLKASSKGLNLVVEKAIDVPQFIYTDEGKLRQVLINLLGNAIEFTSSGCVTLRVFWYSQTQSTNQSGNQPEDIDADNSQSIPELAAFTSSLWFEVEDTGPGINPSELDRLFEPFVQTESGRRSQEGTGLGLPISRQFVHLMGGELTVQSQLGKGSIFRFHIPTQQVEEATPQPELADRRVIGLAPGQPQYRILVVEDNWANRQLLVDLLVLIGFEVQTATNGQEAIEMWRTWLPHLIWMDIRMPLLDGYKATQRIRAEIANRPSPQPSTVIIALTASAFEEDRLAILEAGCDDFVRKPVPERMLLEKIAQYLNVQYIYANPTSGAITHLPNKPTALTDVALEPMSDQLSKMPITWIEQLHRAAQIADEEMILQLIEDIPSAQGQMANTLRELVHHFRLEQIIQITQAKVDSEADPEDFNL
nr:MAG: PAS domain S-box protein [Leptolyngbya sp. IPPAS B-1204]